jgi:Kef-type K+ transport system membrane component KefB
VIEAIAHNPLLVLGLALLAGLACAKLAQLCRVPSVTGFVLAGIAMGVALSEHRAALQRFDVVNDFALGFVAFVIGAELELAHLWRLGRSVVGIVLAEALAAFVLVWIATWAWTGECGLGALLGALASATAPAATVLVIRQLKARGPLTTTLLAVVAIDDALALMIYAFAAVVARSTLSSGIDLSWMSAVAAPLGRIAGGILSGAVVGGVFALFVRRVRNQAELLIAMCGGIILCDGIATQWGFSELLCNMAFGFVLTNSVRDVMSRVLIAIDQLTPPVYTAFFVLAGTQLSLTACTAPFMLGLAALYTTARIAGKLAGSRLGGWAAGAAPMVRRYVGFGLVSQVGVAIALAVVIKREFGDFSVVLRGTTYVLSVMVVNLLLFTTIATEIFGPVLTRLALTRAGEVNQAEY